MLVNVLKEIKSI